MAEEYVFLATDGTYWIDAIFLDIATSMDDTLWWTKDIRKAFVASSPLADDSSEEISDKKGYWLSVQAAKSLAENNHTLSPSGFSLGEIEEAQQIIAELS